MLRDEKTTSPLLVAAAWAAVLVPLGWGVVQSVVKSLPLFVSAPEGSPDRPR